MTTFIPSCQYIYIYINVVANLENYSACTVHIARRKVGANLVRISEGMNEAPYGYTILILSQNLACTARPLLKLKDSFLLVKYSWLNTFYCASSALPCCTLRVTLCYQGHTHQLY